MRTKVACKSRRVQVQIVTYNSSGSVERCLDSVLQQTVPIARIIMVDNASNDNFVQIVETHYPQVEVIRRSSNQGYATGHNVGFMLAANDMDYILTLNPDTELASNYIELLVRELEACTVAGGATGKLLRYELDDFRRPIIDSTGMVMRRFFHVRDRDAGTSDAGQRNTSGLVWGVCGAAALYRVAMLNDLVQDGEVFDQTFFIYKEDVDLCWRAQRRSWSFRYVPGAVGFHERSWVKGRKMPAVAVSHSFSNQIALLIRHTQTLSVTLIVSVCVELARYLLLACSRPKVALRTAHLIRKSWGHHWQARRKLRERDLAKERALYDIGYPGYL